MSITVPDPPLPVVPSADDDPFPEEELWDAADEFEESLAADLLERRVIEAWL